jgi:L-serine dehydratase
LNIAQEAGLNYQFVVEEEATSQPNLVRFEMRNVDGGAEMSVSGASIGGGSIIVTRINSTSLKISLKYNTLIVDHLDKPGAVLSVAKILADNQINIANMNMYRQGKHGRAYMIMETDQIIAPDILTILRRLDDMYVIYIPQLY